MAGFGNLRTEVANKLGINPENICRWLRESEEGEKKNIRVFPGQGNPPRRGVVPAEEGSRRSAGGLGLKSAEIPKKAMAIFAVKNPPIAKYRFMKEYEEKYSVIKMAKVLGVSRGGFYAWEGRKLGRHEEEDQELAKIIELI